MATAQTVYESGGSLGGEIPASGVPHQYASVVELAPYLLMPGIRARAVHGERVTVSIVDLDAGLSMPEHHHANEQVGTVLRGEITFTIGGETRVRRTGDMWVIPSGVPHLVTVGPEGCTVVEVFSPPRDDWAALERGPAGRGDWPI